MNKLSIILLCFSFLSCIKNEELDNNESSVFFENFVELNKKTMISIRLSLFLMVIH